MSETNYVSVPKASKELGLHTNTVYALVSRGTIPSEKFGTRILLTKETVERIEVIKIPGEKTIIRYNEEEQS